MRHLKTFARPLSYLVRLGRYYIDFSCASKNLVANELQRENFAQVNACQFSTKLKIAQRNAFLNSFHEHGVKNSEA